MSDSPVDYQKTLNLPQTDFSMKADLVKKEPLIRQKWEKEDLYHQILKKNQDNPKYILHDGPPYANGDVHCGTALNKILKDIVVKFKTMQGYSTPFVPGWDCHGMPIEHRVMTQLGNKARSLTKSQIRDECEKYARKYIGIQRQQFKALGVFADWERPYLTLDFSYESAVIEVFRDLVKQNYIYRKLKPIHWCMYCETALAEAELEYADETSPSIYVKFPTAPTFAQVLSKKLDKQLKGLPVSFLIWTTTPWTLPANVAIALNPTFEYALIKTNNEYLIIALGLVEKVMDIIGYKNYKVITKINGSQLEGLTYKHPFVNRTCQIILADYVRLEDGTGIVHIAPGHGEEDYESGLKYNLPVISPVDRSGRFTSSAGIFPGMQVFDADEEICRMLKDKGLLLLRKDIVHSYPHCWRCKKPVIFRATEQWFIAVDNNSARQKALKEIKKVKWVPDWGEARISSMLGTRPDWCISRQRNWGVPIPVFYCTRCNEALLDVAVIDSIKEIFRKEGANVWFRRAAGELMPKDTKCPKCSSTEFAKENDIFDVWFESGSSFRAVVAEYPDLLFPADLYLEGTDQHRGWFQLSLLPSVMTRSIAPFKTVLTHGFVKTPEGDKISKSRGTLLLSDEMVSKVGADIVRLWISSINFTDDIPISMEILTEKADPYRKIRNTFRFLLGNLYDFEPEKDTARYEKLWEIDKWALNKLHRLITDVTKYYDDFEFYKVFKEIHNFCIIEMSAFYFDILKDRLYTFAKTSVDRKSAQSVLYEVLLSLTKLVAPILVFSAEEIWGHVLSLNPKLDRSVHLTNLPKADENKINNKLEENYQKIISVRSEVTREIENLRNQDKLGATIEADVKLFTDDASFFEFLKSYEKDLQMILKVSSVQVIKKAQAMPTEKLQLSVEISKSKYQKCSRCWNYTESVGRYPAHPGLCCRCLKVITTDPDPDFIGASGQINT
jgi:isoleucyl-tRNA synthetase